MKDALGHGSNGAGGSKASRESAAIDAIHARTSAAHQARVEMVGRAVGAAKSFAANNSGAGRPVSTQPVSRFMAAHGDMMDPVTLAEMPATHAATHIAHFMGL